MYRLLDIGITENIGLIVSIISLVIALLQNKKCNPCYAKMTKCIFSKGKHDKIEELSVRYGGEDIEQISITTFAFWNKGKIKLSPKDYGSLKPCIKVKGKILDYKLRYVYDSDYFMPSFEVEQDRLDFWFDKDIGFKQGFVIDLIHTGACDRDITVKMKFNDIKYDRLFLYNKKKISIFDALAKVLLWFGLLIFWIILALTAISQNQIESFVYFLISAILTALGLYFVTRENLMPYKGLPKNFKQYFGEIDD